VRCGGAGAATHRGRAGHADEAGEQRLGRLVVELVGERVGHVQEQVDGRLAPVPPLQVVEQGLASARAYQTLSPPHQHHSPWRFRADRRRRDSRWPWPGCRRAGRGAASSRPPGRAESRRRARRPGRTRCPRRRRRPAAPQCRQLRVGAADAPTLAALAYWPFCMLSSM